MRKSLSLLISLGLLFQLSSFSTALAATPAAKAKSKVSTHATTKKPVAHATTKKKSVTTRKATVRHYYKPKRVPVKPSPSPVWPPKGFASSNGVYALIPSGTQLVSLLSSKKALASTVKQCKAMACGAVYVASDSACLYWEINSKGYGPNPSDVTATIEYGTLRTLARATKSHEILPVILVSNEPLFPHESIILSTLGISQNNFYTQIAQSKSLTQIAGAKINSVVSAISTEESKAITAQLAAGSITSDQAQALLDATSVRIATELTNYNLSVGGITVSCWTEAPTESLPSSTYSMATNHF